MTNKECLTIAVDLLRIQGVRISYNLLKEKLYYNAKFPSLLSISEVFRQLDLSTLIVQIGVNELPKIPLPCITLVKNSEDEHLVILTEITPEKVTYKDYRNKQFVLPVSDFSKIWEGKVLLIETNKNSGEDLNSFSKNLILQKTELISKVILTIVFLCFLVYLVPNIEWDLPYTVLLIKIFGVIISLLLLVKTYGSQNKLLNSLCTFGSKNNCDDIIKSEHLKLLNTYSLSEIALVYYISGFVGVLFLIFSSFNAIPYSLLPSFIAFIISLITIYIQAFKLKKWCTLCLALSSLMWVEFTIGVVYLRPFSLEFKGIIYFITLFVFFSSIWVLLRRDLMSVFQLTNTKRRLNHFLYNDEVFNGLLNLSPIKVNHNIPIEIELGNPRAKNHVILVTSPTCHYCRKVHEMMEELLQEYNFKLTIRFFINYKIKDSTNFKVAESLILLATFEDKKLLNTALQEWFINRVDLEKFLSKYDTNNVNNNNILLSLKESLIWGLNQGITLTPTLIISGQKVPSGYSSDQIRYHIKGILEE